MYVNTLTNGVHCERSGRTGTLRVNGMVGFMAVLGCVQPVQSIGLIYGPEAASLTPAESI